jgi:PEP-CTERM motif
MKSNTTRFWRGTVAVAALFWIVLSATGRDARADVITTSPSLPPNVGAYQSAPGALTTFNYGGNSIVVELISLQPNAATATQDFVSSPGNEIDTFASILSGAVSVNGSAFSQFTLSDPSTRVEEFGRTSSNQLGTFNTQMLNLDLTATVGGTTVEARLDPTNPTTGQTTITNVGGGEFQIHSFFDVFTEISLDHGPFVPQNSGPTVLTLQNTPEPASLTLLGTSIAAFGAFRLRRWRRKPSDAQS